MISFILLLEYQIAICVHRSVYKCINCDMNICTCIVHCTCALYNVQRTCCITKYDNIIQA